MARLVRNNLFDYGMVKVDDGASLQNIWVDGERGALGYHLASSGVIVHSGNLGTSIYNDVISNPTGWTSLYIGERDMPTPGSPPPCTGNFTVQHLLITAYPATHSLPPANPDYTDGITDNCENAVIGGNNPTVDLGNQIVDATDVAIVVFGIPSATQHSTVQKNTILSAGNNAWGALIADPGTDGASKDFTGTLFDSNIFWTGPYTSFAIGGGDTRLWWNGGEAAARGPAWQYNSMASYHAYGVNTRVQFPYFDGGIDHISIIEPTDPFSFVTPLPTVLGRCPAPQYIVGFDDEYVHNRTIMVPAGYPWGPVRPNYPCIPS
jgi:hypothetical protein